MKLTLAAAAAAVLALSSLQAQANMLTFDGDICSASANGSGAFTACGNFVAINQAYGDSAMVDVSYRYDNGNPNSMQFWADSYSGMSAIAFGGADPTIRIVPTAGNVVTLNSFNIGAWPNINRASQVTVVDLATMTAILATGPITILGSVPSLFSFSNAMSSAGFTITFGPDGFNVGIDNVSFDIAPIPEPGTWALLAAGLVLVASRAARQRRDAGVGEVGVT